MCRYRISVNWLLFVNDSTSGVGDLTHKGVSHCWDLIQGSAPRRRRCWLFYCCLVALVLLLVWEGGLCPLDRDSRGQELFDVFLVRPICAIDSPEDSPQWQTIVFLSSALEALFDEVVIVIYCVGDAVGVHNEAAARELGDEL